MLALTEPDVSGRAGVTAVGETKWVPADTVIAAVGEKVPGSFYTANGIHVDEKGRPLVNEHLETNLEGVYVIGDGLYGPSLVVKGMAEAMKAAEAVTGRKVSEKRHEGAKRQEVYGRKGILAEPGEKKEAKRCLSCSTVCENCVDVCPNRANVEINVPGMAKTQIVHVDYMCNECGNCRSFCPYTSAPYLDKFTLFAGEADMADSRNEGFVILDREKVSCKVRYLGEEFLWEKGQEGKLPKGLEKLMETVCKDYTYL